MNGTYRFYSGLLDNEEFICQCNDDDLMGEPAIGDFINLPIGVGELDQELYVVKQRIIDDDCIEFFCKLYNWED